MPQHSPIASIGSAANASGPGCRPNPLVFKPAKESVVLGIHCANFPPVRRFFQPNISHRGRMARGVIGALCLIAGIIVAGDYTLWGLVLVGAGLFAMVEAAARWCLVRACGIKTRI